MGCPKQAEVAGSKVSASCCPRSSGLPGCSSPDDMTISDAAAASSVIAGVGFPRKKKEMLKDEGQPALLMSLLTSP